MHTHKSPNALRWNAISTWTLGALGNGKAGTGKTTDAGVDVPETGTGLGWGGEVVFYEDGTGLCRFAGED